MKFYKSILEFFLILVVFFSFEKTHAQVGKLWKIYNFTNQKLSNVKLGFKVATATGDTNFYTAAVTLEAGMCDPKVPPSLNMAFTSFIPMAGLGQMPINNPYVHFYIILEDVNHRPIKIFLNDPKAPAVFIYDMFKNDPCSRGMITYNEKTAEVYITP